MGRAAAALWGVLGVGTPENHEEWKWQSTKRHPREVSRTMQFSGLRAQKSWSECPEPH